MPEVVIYGRSPSVVVDDVATFVDLEHGLEFTVDDYVHGLFQCGCKVHLEVLHEIYDGSITVVAFFREEVRHALVGFGHEIV